MFLVSRKAREGQRAQSFFWMMCNFGDVGCARNCFFEGVFFRAKNAKGKGRKVVLLRVCFLYGVF